MNMQALASSPVLAKNEPIWTYENKQAVVELYAEEGFGRDGSRRIVEWEMLQGVCVNFVSIYPDNEESHRVAIIVLADFTSALSSLVRLWELRLQNVHKLIPMLRISPEKSNPMIKPVFLAHMDSLVDGDVVKELLHGEKRLRSEIAGANAKLRKFRRLEDNENLRATVTDKSFRCDQILLRVSEFRNAMGCLGRVITSLESDEKVAEANPVFKFASDWTWSQLHSIIRRECRRLQAELPLYARRSEIVSQLDSNQVVVLVGETGSGKSTQLVQYLYDAGYSKAGRSIVCTQPRKVAALNLTQRVKEESKGCYSGPYPVGCITCSSAQSSEHLANINFTTDFILLQLCLLDPLLSIFSCVVVDEAHVRSLNVDLLLAMLKNALRKRPDLKVVIMSATSDAELLSAYFGSTEILRVVGRNFPVDVIYEPGDSLEAYDEYLNRTLKKVREIHKNNSEGNILAFLTSPAEVDWACSQSFETSAVVQPLHGQLQHEDLRRAFQDNTSSWGRRKIVFATNYAESSFTIPGVRYVVDCGLAKESAFDPKKGMNVLQLRKIDQSSAIQRAGRAGRTQPGVCYRLYSKAEFEKFASHSVPEIKRVHLGVAILKLMALGIKEVGNFDFVEVPEPFAIETAIRVLDQVGAVKQDPGSGDRCLTGLGWNLVKLGLEPRLGKILLDSIHQGFGQEGLVISSLMSNSGMVFCRSGSEEMKERADRLKMRFCHPHGELFTLLSVYQQWESQPERWRSQWCSRNFVSFRAMKRCQDQVIEMRNCLRYELKLRVPSTYKWSPSQPIESSTPLRKIIFEALAGNLAVSTGYSRFGYTVVSTGQRALLHPSSSIFVYGTTPDFVVYGEILHTSNTFLDLVTVVESEWIQSLRSSLQYDVDALEASIMRRWVVSLTSSNFLSRVSGKQGQKLLLLKEAIEDQYHEPCVIHSCYENNSITVYTTPTVMEIAQKQVQKLMSREMRWLENEVLEKPLIPTATTSPVMLVGGGAVIVDVLMPGESVSVEILYRSSSVLDEIGNEEVLERFDACGEGLAGFEKWLRGSKLKDGLIKWGVVRYKSSCTARLAVQLLDGTTLIRDNIPLIARLLEESNTNSAGIAPLPAVKATLAWARRKRKGWVTVRCDPEDREIIIEAVETGGQCYASVKRDECKDNSFYFKGVDTEDENAIKETLIKLSGCRIVDCYMPRNDAPSLQPSVKKLNESIVQLISEFVAAGMFHVLVLQPKEKDFFSRAEVHFDESVHEGATRALETLEGSVLPDCLSWQTITCQRMFSAQVYVSRLMCGVLMQDLQKLVAALQEKYTDARIIISSRDKGSHRVQVSAPSMAVVAKCKSSFGNLMEGQAIVAEGLDESTVRLLTTKRGLQISRAVEMQTKTLVLWDKRTHVAKIYGPLPKKAEALQEIVVRLKKLDIILKSRQIPLRGEGMPPGLMREIVKTHGFDLRGLRRLVTDNVEVAIDNRSHILSVNGGDMEVVIRIQTVVAEMAAKLSEGQAAMCSVPQWRHGIDEECCVCFCPMEDKYCLMGCGHSFCRACLLDQINSSIRHKSGFPITCAHENCHQFIMLPDIENLLSFQQQEELHKAALSAFVAQHSLSYRFCTTADCPNVYRVTKSGYPFRCAGCSIQICTTCHVEYHEDLSCEEYELYKLDPDASLQAWREGKTDVKNCPSCGSVIEKVDGCNHIHCTMCDKHVCWECLNTFEVSIECYEHMKFAHEQI